MSHSKSKFPMIQFCTQLKTLSNSTNSHYCVLLSLWNCDRCGHGERTMLAKAKFCFLPKESWICCTFCHWLVQYSLLCSHKSSNCLELSNRYRSNLQHCNSQAHYRNYSNEKGNYNRLQCISHWEGAEWWLQQFEHWLQSMFMWALFWVFQKPKYPRYHCLKLLKRYRYRNLFHNLNVVFLRKP